MPDHLVDEIVGNELPLVHQGLGRFAEFSAVRDVGAKDVAGGDLRDAVGGHEGFGLRAFADAGSSQKKNRPGQKVLLCRGRCDAVLAALMVNVAAASYQLLRPRMRPLLGVKPS